MHSNLDYAINPFEGNYPKNKILKLFLKNVTSILFSIRLNKYIFGLKFYISRPDDNDKIIINKIKYVEMFKDKDHCESCFEDGDFYINRTNIDLNLDSKSITNYENILTNLINKLFEFYINIGKAVNRSYLA